MSRTDAENKLQAALDRIESLKEWIRETGGIADICTYPVLGETCKGCACKRKPKAVK